LIFLGCDPGYRHFGLCLADIEGDTINVRKRATLRNGSIKDWQKGIPTLLAGVYEFISRIQMIDKAAVEMISWYGKRRGSLQLAHLAGATVGYLLAAPNIGPVRFYSPKEVKTTSANNKLLRGFDEHQHDALSLCRLLASST